MRKWDLVMKLCDFISKSSTCQKDRSEPSNMFFTNTERVATSFPTENVSLSELVNLTSAVDIL